MDTVSHNIVDTCYTRFIITHRDISNNGMDRLPNTSMDTVSNNIVDTSFTRFIITDRDISNNAIDRLPNTSMDTVYNNIVDTSYTRFIIIDIEIYLTMLWTDYQIHQWTLYPTQYCGH